ncbi:hypothetical protein W02_01320 [Nitrospira sp. KM1]|uniref:acyl-CoA dehydrogenase family protein n=1 Tax=Nitrospira sp. KM1 TaxID=1936990 RepID=UPI0013A75EA0|nr:acyl-CoA dehydrogenase family protein [Nitrospira sp. KM1]BCA52992.1 hypothetical protein W02_01320 [Nitrospira sp. KM1]
MAAISDRLRTFLAQRADGMNDGTVPGEQAIHAIAQEEWLGLGVPARLGGSGGPLLGAIESIAAVSEYCLTSGFLLWCHRMLIEYLAHSENPWLHEQVLPRLLTADLHGATGLSNAVKHLAGIEPLRVEAELRAENVTINGSLAWVSNLAPGGFAVAVAARTGGDRWAVIAVPSSGKGVEAGKELPLFGLGSSLTAPIRFDRVSLPATWLIHEDGETFLRRIRARFVLLQIGLSLGLARRSLSEASSAGRDLTQGLAKRADTIAATLRRFEEAVREYGCAESLDPEELPHVFELRIALANLAIEAVWFELQAKGGRAYLKGCGTGRRLREAAFLPIVSPTCVQLEEELNRHYMRAPV